MCESEKINRAMLQEHVNKDVTIILDTLQNNVFQGVLSREKLTGFEDAECWAITSNRGQVQQGSKVLSVPQTKIHFSAKHLRAVVVPQETEKEASERLEAEKISRSLASPGWGHKQ